MVRHVIVGGGTAGMNAITTIRQYDKGASEIVLVASERPYARMVLPYYLKGDISEAHVYTATPARLRALDVQTYIGRRAVGLDPQAGTVTLDDGTQLAYDDLLIATGSSPVRPPVPGADAADVYSFWTLEQAQAVLHRLRPGCHVAMVGAGFIAFTILNAILARQARLTVVEIAPQVLPRMIDAQGAKLVEEWLRQRGVHLRTGANLTAIEPADGRKRLRFQEGEDVVADVVILATGIRPNLEWLEGTGLAINRGVLVDEHLRSNVPNVYAAGDIAEGRDLVRGEAAVHAIEPTAMEHGRVVGANMAGQPVAYRGSLLMNIVEVLDLEIASFGAWDDPQAEVSQALVPERFAYRKLLWRGDRLVGAMLIGPSREVWTSNDLGMLKGLVQSGIRLGAWKSYLHHHPFDVKRAFIAAGTTARLLPQTVLGSPSVPAAAVAVRRGV
ncbi:MAG: pyridine nucleotide-disulfide oxidoreductase [Candidatus Tectimicrobiota bacterium]|nr:MAG: pyridine nucleotide-disulfide oxidoreductase [Candidatus Tectomicrobia bacterium]